MGLWQQIRSAVGAPRATGGGDGVPATVPGPAAASPAVARPAADTDGGDATEDGHGGRPQAGVAEDTRTGVPEPEPIWAHPLVRAGALAWGLVGLVVVLVGAAAVLRELSVLVVPFVLALFPAALLSPLMRLLVARRVPPALAALLVIFGSIGLLVGVGSLLAEGIADEAPAMVTSVEEGIADLEAFLDEGPFGLEPDVIAGWLETGREQLIEVGSQAAGSVASAVAEGVAGLLFGLVALFFYLKDGARIADWLRRLFPAHLRTDAKTIGTQAWVTIGSYFRGQLFIALVDAVLIGLGLVLLRVPLALPLAVLIFFGGLFPIVGALASGAVAVLVALAASGPGAALVVLALIVGVQQFEGNVLAPVVLGKATALHPLAVILALAAGGIVLGVLGAFLAVPVAASLTRAIGYLRTGRGGGSSSSSSAVSPAAPASAGGR
ncbi:MAG: AI-2E family transporter [Egibacteraceae bacterium]